MPKNIETLEDFINSFINETDEIDEVLDDTETMSWKDHEAAVNEAKEKLQRESAASNRLSARNSNDLVAKAVEVVELNLNKLLDGDILVENAQELIATIQAVDNVLNLARSHKKYHV